MLPHCAVELGEHSEKDERKAHMSDQALLETESKRAKDASLHEKNNSTVPLLHLVKLLLRLVQSEVILSSRVWGYRI